MSTINVIIVNVQSLFDVAISEVCDCVQRKLQDVSLSSEVSELVTAELHDGSLIPRLSHGLETHHQQVHYFRTKFSLVVGTTLEFQFMTCLITYTL